MMALNQVVPFRTKEGCQYLIEFSLANELIVFSDPISIAIVDVAITQLDVGLLNNASTLFQIANIIKSYLEVNNVALYCYCDTKEIQRGKNKKDMLPQQYRSLLFSRMFERNSDSTYVNHVIVVKDEINGDHYINLIANKSNQSQLNAIEKELCKLNK